MSIKITIEVDLADLDNQELAEAARELLRLAVAAQASHEKSKDQNPVRRRRAPQPRPLSGTDKERWTTFVNGMSPTAQAFEQLVRDKYPDALSRREALDALGLNSGKALGGLTGAFGRWSAIDGLTVPWVREIVDDEPAWRWEGFDENGDCRVVDSPTASAATSTSFWEGLSDRSQRFLDIIRERDSITVQDVLTELGLDDPRALGGISGSIRRWGRAAGVDLPYENIRLNGRKGFRWKTSSE